ncbi:hypothetical protein CEXT_508861 [Caerostris extrusa]|uniref:Uncharacterized protein n=1 Tax=Caerostris extrusa TaxID=172846 RepID=A0AAV4M9G0_CAEEX|nr:hypothetical protein CEXT_508861 [Caerostris extrusa]
MPGWTCEEKSGELLFQVALSPKNKDPEATRNSVTNKIPHLIGGFNMRRMPRIGIRQILFSYLEMHSFIPFAHLLEAWQYSIFFFVR